MNGTILDIDAVFDNLDKYIEDHAYTVISLGYDPYNAEKFVQRWVMGYGPSDVNKVPQNRQSETVPLTEMKKLAEDKKFIFDQQMMSYTMGNCIVEVDINGNKRLMKRKYSDKIDAVAALMDAFVAYKLNLEAF